MNTQDLLNDAYDEIVDVTAEIEELSERIQALLLRLDEAKDKIADAEENV